MNNIEELNRPDAESAVIATLLIHPDYYYNSEALLPNHFSRHDNQLLYTAITNLVKQDVKSIDALNIMESLSSNPETTAMAKEITVERVQELVDMSDVIARSSPEDYVVCANAVLDAAFRRDMYKTLGQCEKLCLDKRQTDLQQKIYLNIENMMDGYSLNDNLQQFGDIIDDCWHDIQDPKKLGYDTRFPLLNNYVRFTPGELIVFAGRQKAGKSMVALDIAMDMIFSGHSVLYLDSELSDVMFTKRVLSYLTQIPYIKIDRGVLTDSEKQIINTTVDQLKKLKFSHVYMPYFDIQEVYTMTKKAYHKWNVDVLIVDYIKANGSSDEAYANYSELGRFVDVIKNKLCGDLGIVGFATAQATEKGTLADSVKISRNASTILLMTEKTQDEIEAQGMECGNRKLRVMFNRNGPQMRDDEWIDLQMNGDVINVIQAPQQHVPELPF